MIGNEGGSSRALDRREFLQVGSAATAVAAIAANGSAVRAADEPAKADGAAKAGVLPTRVLGKTGVPVSILNQGTWRNPSLDKLLRFSYANGVRYYDTAKSYGSEPGIGKWFQAMPEVRKSIFLVTKDSPREPEELIKMLDKRLEDLKTDYVDLLFVHALGDKHNLKDAIRIASGPEMKAVAEKIKKSGKAKFIGFSSHHVDRAQILAAAAKANFVDAIMVQNTAWLDKDTDLNRALDACHKAGIGLISMKQVAGANPENFLKEVPQKAPELIAKGLTPYQALLHAIWSDERFSTVCVSMRNTDQVRENAEAARKYEPLKAAEIESLRKAFLASRPSLCPDCDGRCSVAAGTKAPLGDLTRFLTYSERHGLRTEARRYYSELDEAARDWSDADLVAAKEACPSKLDFASLLPRVDRQLS